MCDYILIDTLFSLLAAVLYHSFFVAVAISVLVDEYSMYVGNIHTFVRI